MHLFTQLHYYCLSLKYIYLYIWPGMHNTMLLFNYLVGHCKQYKDNDFFSDLGYHLCV